MYNIVHILYIPYVQYHQLSIVRSLVLFIASIIIICAGVTKNLSLNLCNNQLKLLTKVDHSVAARSLVDLIKG